MTNRKVKLLFMEPQIIVHIMNYLPGKGSEKDRFIEINNYDCPSDAQVVAISYDHPTQCFACLLSHETFEEVPMGEMPPIIEPKITIKNIDPATGEPVEISSEEMEQLELSEEVSDSTEPGSHLPDVAEDLSDV